MQVMDEGGDDDAAAGGSSESNGDLADTKKCNCKKSRCLKLYCECFSSGKQVDQRRCWAPALHSLVTSFVANSCNSQSLGYVQAFSAKVRACVETA